MTCVTALKVTVWAHLGFYELKGQIELEKNVLCVSCVLCVWALSYQEFVKYIGIKMTI